MTFSFSTVAQCNRIHFPLFLKPFLSFSLLDATWQAASFFDICLSLSHVQRLPVAVPRWLVCKTRKEMTCVCFFLEKTNNRHHTLYVSLPHVVLVKFNTGIKKKKNIFVLLRCAPLMLVPHYLREEHLCLCSIGLKQSSRFRASQILVSLLLCLSPPPSPLPLISLCVRHPHSPLSSIFTDCLPSVVNAKRD